jgi:hypothetical protein
VIVNAHDAVVPRASVAVQSTVVVPTAKSDADGREQDTVTGGTPPPASGAGKLTATGSPVVDTVEIPAGQVSVNAEAGGSLDAGGPGAGDEGAVGDEHPAARARTTTNAAGASVCAGRGRRCGGIRLRYDPSPGSYFKAAGRAKAASGASSDNRRAGGGV